MFRTSVPAARCSLRCIASGTSTTPGARYMGHWLLMSGNCGKLLRAAILSGISVYLVCSDPRVYLYPRCNVPTSRSLVPGLVVVYTVKRTPDLVSTAQSTVKQHIEWNARRQGCKYSLLLTLLVHADPLHKSCSPISIAHKHERIKPAFRTYRLLPGCTVCDLQLVLRSQQCHNVPTTSGVACMTIIPLASISRVNHPSCQNDHKRVLVVTSRRSSQF